MTNIVEENERKKQEIAKKHKNCDVTKPRKQK